MNTLGTVPTFFVYGEAPRPFGLGFVHAETVMARRDLHFGRVEPHLHDRLAQITFWTKGHGSYLIEDEVLDFSAPAVSFMPSGVVHGFTVAADETDAIVISIADGALSSIAGMVSLPLSAPVMIRDAADPALWDRLSRTMHLVLDEYAHAAASAETVTMPLVAAALGQIAVLAAAVPAPAVPPQRHLANRLRELVDAHFRDNWPIATYVDALGTTSHLLAKASLASFGVPVKELIAERRLLEAKRLLLFTVRSVEDIAYEIGIRDAAYFSRAFRKRMGQPPGEWRRSQSEVLGSALARPGANG
ncbi:helix-turn-helix domain-containing protein [Mesorhizobium australicum]|uniref:AraC family transcriptional regulator, transcriptional activator of pobA n=1 Tax=Mesorhizobium australicum TaxID=536018 RepID=A0A1X7PQN0_9HYPH|nr:helix-turn-helix domain-containing protein [Mesorhizobium australicum]SMH54280.1 AraC family transcriptional regulator, transcriptional activator of pobA [Mesorhizobium australicum]